MNSPFTKAQLHAAADLVQQHMSPTPQYCWPLLSAALNVPVWVKHENMTPTGAFKVRGGLVYLNQLVNQGGRPPGLITATRGNHGQSLPYAARPYGLPVTVVVPAGNSKEKNASIEGWGARLVEAGQDFDEARVAAAALAQEHGLEFVPSFHPLLVLGVATYTLELLTAVPDLKTLYVPIGMGSGICGAIAVRDLLGCSTEVVGVVASGADAMARSFAEGRTVSTAQAKTFADGVATREPNAEALAAILQGAARVVTVPDAQVARAMRLLFRATHQVAEGAGAIGLAAIMQERDSGVAGSGPVGMVLSGGNIDAAQFALVLAGGTPDP